MRLSSTTFRPYDRATGTELTPHQQSICRAYYFIIKAYIDGVDSKALRPIPWTRRSLRCSTAELVESIQQVADDIRRGKRHALAGNDGISSVQSWAEAEGLKLAAREPDVSDPAFERYQQAVNLLHELVSRLADVDESPKRNLEEVPAFLSPPSSMFAHFTPGSASATFSNAPSSRTSGMSAASTKVEEETISADDTEFPLSEDEQTHKLEEASFPIDPFDEPPVEPVSAQARQKHKDTSDWVFEYLRGGWHSNTFESPAQSAFSFMPPLMENTSPVESIRSLQRTASDSLSMLSEDGVRSAPKGWMKARGRPIPNKRSHRKGRFNSEVPLGISTKTSTASGMEMFVTPQSIFSGDSVFVSPDAGFDDPNSTRKTNTSAWNKYLRQKGLIPEPFEEMDWSGRGQHAEFEATEEEQIPLVLEKNLGYSATALVESVRCKRIRLARKSVRVSRRLKKEEAMQEVEHLQRLKHPHIVRVVGTYTLPCKLSILLYPVADYTLDAFLESVDDGLPAQEQATRLYSISTFLRCLAKGLAYIHEKAMKHMDIKPKNLLVRNMQTSTICNQGKYKIYIADFGIARSYRSVDDCDTESPTAFTKAYAAPEVIAQERRAQKADIFSLGAVYAEMLAVLALQDDSSTSHLDRLHELRESNFKDHSYAAHAPVVQHFVRDLCLTTYGFESDTVHSHITELVALMLSVNPAKRPSAATIVENIPFRAFCCDVNGGAEPFEAADRPVQRQLYDRAMEIAEADVRYWRCSVDGCVKVYSSQGKLKYHDMHGHGGDNEGEGVDADGEGIQEVGQVSAQQPQQTDWSTF